MPEVPDKCSRAKQASRARQANSALRPMDRVKASSRTDRKTRSRRGPRVPQSAPERQTVPTESATVWPSICPPCGSESSLVVLSPSSATVITVEVASTCSDIHFI